METPGPAAGDVLAQPTRARLFDLLQELKRETSTEELAGGLGLHINGVRRHSSASGGRVGRASRQSEGRGRPRDLWSVAADANPGGQRPRAYARPCRLAGERHPGRARSSAPGRANRPRDRTRSGTKGNRGFSSSLRAGLSALGFQPQLELEQGGRACCRLGNCPYTEAVVENQPVVCTCIRA